MKELMLTVFAATFFSTQIIVIAIIVIALIVIIGAVFVLRSGKNKKGAAVGAPGSNADWQRQQPGAGQPGAWNQQAGANSWGQPGQPAQQAGAWGAPNTAGQANSWGAQQPNNPWGAPAQGQQPDNPWATANPAQAQQGNNPWAGANPAQAQAQQPDPWGTPNPAQAQQSNNPWGAPNTAQPQQPNNPWAAANPAQSNNAWGATASPAQPQQPNNAWGAQGQGGQSSWEAAPAGAPAAQDAWGQTPAPSQQDPWRQGQAGAAQQPWGGAGAAPQGQNNGYGANTSGASWGQPQQPADPWAAQQAAQMPGGAQSGSSWQQGNMGQQGYAMSDNDKTMLRPGGAVQGPQAGLGYVRVEEGKEPGRTYEVRKESLSIGRSRESDIFLEDLAVSRLHASVVNMGNGNYALKDEGSANGTKVNGQLVNKFQTYPLQEGDRIQLGQTVLVFGRK